MKGIDGVYIKNVTDFNKFYEFLDDNNFFDNPVFMFFKLNPQSKIYDIIHLPNIKSRWADVNSETILYHNFISSYDVLSKLETNLKIAKVSKKESFSPEIGRKEHAQTADPKYTQTYNDIGRQI